MSGTPLVSVVIPTWNRAHTICRAVRSALESTYASLEVIVCDNGSDDQTLDVLAPLCDDPRLRLVSHETNMGPLPNWESGLNAARGELVKILWSDDAVERETIALLAKPLAEDPTLGFAFGPAQIGVGDNPTRVKTHYRIGRRSCRIDLLDMILGLSLRVPHLPWSPGAAVLRADLAREGLLEARRIDEACYMRGVGPDAFMLYWPLVRGLDGVFVPEARSLFFEDARSITVAERTAGRLWACYHEAVGRLLLSEKEMLRLFDVLCRVRPSARPILAGARRPEVRTLLLAARRLARWSLRKGGVAWSR